MAQNRINIEHPASKMTKITSALAIAAALGLGACQNQLLKQAEYFERNGQPGKAETVLVQHLAQHPDDGRAQYQLAELYGAQKKFAEMVDALAAAEKHGGRLRESALQLKEKYWRETYNEGVRALLLEQPPEAVTALQHATLILPERHAAYPVLGAALLSHQQTTAAQTVFEQACRLDPDDLDSRHALLRIYFDRGLYEQAIAASEEALRLLRNDLSALRCRALSLERMASANASDSLNLAAENALKRLLSVSLSMEDFAALGAHYYRRGDFRNAALQFEDAARLGRDNKDVLRYLGDCAWQLGDYATMSKWYTRLVQSHPNDVEALQNLLIAEQALGRKNEVQKLQSQLQQLQGSIE